MEKGETVAGWEEGEEEERVGGGGIKAYRIFWG